MPFKIEGEKSICESIKIVKSMLPCDNLSIKTIVDNTINNPLTDTDKYILVKKVKDNTLILPSINGVGRLLVITNDITNASIDIVCAPTDAFDELPSNTTINLPPGFSLKLVSFPDKKWLNIS